MKLLRMTTHEFARLDRSLCFWPVGTVEAHDAGPLGTDVIAPEKLAEDLASEFGAILLPTMPFGLVNSLSGYPGGMWMQKDTYRALVVELLDSVSVSGIEQVVVFNGHGGNSETLSEALSEVWKSCGVRTALVDWWVVGDDIAREIFGSSAGHGGSDELALVQAAIPDFVPEWDGSGSWLDREGVRAYPAPACSIRYSDSEAKPFSVAAASVYYERLRDRIRGIVSEILEGWSAGGRIDG